jgi:hypothetical protein
MDEFSFATQLPPPPRRDTEERCKYCGGYLLVVRCENANIYLYGKYARPEFDGVNIRDVKSLSDDLLALLDLCLKNPRPCKLYGVEFRTSGETALCEECDGLLSIDTLTNPCPDCRKNPERQELLYLEGKIEIPPDAEYTFTYEDEVTEYGEQWKGYKVEVIGKRLGRFSGLKITPELAEMQHLLPYSFEEIKAAPWLLLPFFCLEVPEDPDLIVKVYQLKARYKDSPLYVEVRYPPHCAPITTIRGVESKHTKKDREKAQDALDLLGIIAERGRSTGRSRDLEAETLSSIANTFAYIWFCYSYKEIIDSRGRPKKPGLEELSHHYSVERTTLHRHITGKLKGTWSGKDGVRGKGIKIAQELTVKSLPDYYKTQFHIE